MNTVNSMFTVGQFVSGLPNVLTIYSDIWVATFFVLKVSGSTYTQVWKFAVNLWYTAHQLTRKSVQRWRRPSAVTHDIRCIYDSNHMYVDNRMNWLLSQTSFSSMATASSAAHPAKLSMSSVHLPLRHMGDKVSASSLPYSSVSHITPTRQQWWSISVSTAAPHTARRRHVSHMTITGRSTYT